MRIKITSDSTCDLSKEILEKRNISLFPLVVIKGGKEFRDGVDISPAEIFEFVDNGGEITTTSAINTASYLEYFAPFSKDYDAVIHFDISAEFSSCYQNACIAAKEFDNVYVVDTRNLSTGSGLIVLNAAIMAEEGKSAEEIVEKSIELSRNTEASFVVDRMDYLRKGGRCSSIVAVSATLLRIKPCIEVKDGKMSVGKKYQGSFERALKKYVEERLKGRDDIDQKRIFITHTHCSEEIVDLVRQVIDKYQKFDEIIETTAGCTISSHCGPNTLGILFFRK